MVETGAVDDSIFRGKYEPLVEFEQFGWTPEDTDYGGDSNNELIKTLSFYKNRTRVRRTPWRPQLALIVILKHFKFEKINLVKKRNFS